MKFAASVSCLIPILPFYGVETKALNRALKRNRDRFPKDFMFQISSNEWKNLKYQIGASSPGRESQALRYQFGTLKIGRGRYRKYRPYAFTEHGAIMAANVLNSQRAVQMSVFVVRAFLKMRSLLGDKRELAGKLATLEKELKKRLDVHEVVIVTFYSASWTSSIRPLYRRRRQDRASDLNPDFWRCVLLPQEVYPSWSSR